MNKATTIFFLIVIAIMIQQAALSIAGYAAVGFLISIVAIAIMTVAYFITAILLMRQGYGIEV